MVGTDRVVAEAGLIVGRLGCPRCGGVLGPWGYARRRVVRHSDGEELIRPRRGRCRTPTCVQRTHVLLPDSTLIGRRDDVERMGQAILAKAARCAKPGSGPGPPRGAAHRTPRSAPPRRPIQGGELGLIPRVASPDSSASRICARWYLTERPAQRHQPAGSPATAGGYIAPADTFRRTGPSRVIGDFDAVAHSLNAGGGWHPATGVALRDAVSMLDKATGWVREQATTNRRAAAAAGAPYLRLFGLVAGGAQLVDSARACPGAARRRRGRRRVPCRQDRGRSLLRPAPAARRRAATHDHRRRRGARLHHRRAALTAADPARVRARPPRPSGAPASWRGRGATGGWCAGAGNRSTPQCSRRHRRGLAAPRTASGLAQDDEPTTRRRLV
jgi:hypothetical protein